eukprot:7985276-Pyramimonas_sp.AAC.2
MPKVGTVSRRTDRTTRRLIDDAKAPRATRGPRASECEDAIGRLARPWTTASDIIKHNMTYAVHGATQ